MSVHVSSELVLWSAFDVPRAAAAAARAGSLRTALSDLGPISVGL